MNTIWPSGLNRNVVLVILAFCFGFKDRNAFRTWTVLVTSFHDYAALPPSGQFFLRRILEFKQSRGFRLALKTHTWIDWKNFSYQFSRPSTVCFDFLINRFFTRHLFENQGTVTCFTDNHSHCVHVCMTLHSIWPKFYPKICSVII